ncbi:hypothetical protein EJB05_44618, partial [Eragrostis curvula]
MNRRRRCATAETAFVGARPTAERYPSCNELPRYPPRSPNNGGDGASDNDVAELRVLERSSPSSKIHFLYPICPGVDTDSMASMMLPVCRKQSTGSIKKHLGATVVTMTPGYPQDQRAE